MKLAETMAALGQVEKSVVLDKMELSSDVFSPLVPLKQFALKTSIKYALPKLLLPSHNDAHMCRRLHATVKRHFANTKQILQLNLDISTAQMIGIHLYYSLCFFTESLQCNFVIIESEC